MAGENKKNDFAIELDDRQEHHGNFGPSSASSRAESPALSPTAAAAMSSSGNSLSNNPMLSVFSYCFSSILMTVTNKYVLSGTNFNMNFVLLCVQVSGQRDNARMRWKWNNSNTR